MYSLLEILVILAGGYIAYDELRRFKVTGYALYFRTTIVGLVLLCIAYVGIVAVEHFGMSQYVLDMSQDVRSFLKIDPEINRHQIAPFLTIIVAIFIKIWWIVTKYIQYYIFKILENERIITQQNELEMKNLEEKGFGKFVHEKTLRATGTSILLSNNEVVIGWIHQIFTDEAGQWIRVEECATGYKTKQGTIKIQNVYKKERDQEPEEEDFIFVPMDKVLTIQTFRKAEFKKLIAEIPEP